MATRVFDSNEIHEETKFAQRGLDIRIEEDWRDDQRSAFDWQTEDYIRRKTRADKYPFFFRQPKYNPGPFDQWLEERKGLKCEFWRGTLWESHSASYKDIRHKLTNLGNLAGEQMLSVTKHITLDTKDYNLIRFHVGFYNKSQQSKAEN